MAKVYRHGQCEKQWTGLTNGHCSACHETFSSGAFDRHQSIDKGVITCSTDGLIPCEMPWGILWRLPGPDNPWWRNVKTVELPDDPA